MKIIHFSTADNEGGSAHSAYRIHTGLRLRGHDSKMLVGKKVTSDPDVALAAGSKLGRYIDLLADRATRLVGDQYLRVPSSSRLPNHPWIKHADIIQLYNTHGGYFSHTILPTLSKIAPIVWRLSDMWPMTPHSAYAYGCECYKKGPEVCICKLTSYPPIYRNTKRLLWDTKKRVYAKSNITIVAPSSWAEKQAKESILLKQFDICRIPNGINLEIFHPRDKQEARRKFGIDLHVKVILFSAHGLDHNPRKGSDLLIQALNHLGSMKNALLVLAGEGGQSFLNAVPMPVKLLGYHEDQNIMAQIYSSADVIAVPSIVENLPNNLLESMACSTPAVAFDAGGISDAVHHMKTGYLAKQGDSADFANGLGLLLKDTTLRDHLAKNALALIEDSFSKEKEIESFEKLYEKL